MKQLGPYELLEEIARGGIGVVYRARGPLGEVALKVLLDPDPDPRFLQEARAAARLGHPGIVSVHDVGEDSDGRAYLVMELVEGESLQAKLKREGPLPVEEAVELTVQLCEAVGYAHDEGVIHRDLKPQNVLVTPEGRVKLADFGLARVVDQTQNLTQTGEVLGTPAYMPPEQVEGNRAAVGPLSDVYGLGATLYALLTGRPPFQGASLVNLLNAVLEDTPRPPSAHRSGLPPELDAVCLHCLAKAPADRYPSAAALASALRPSPRETPPPPRTALVAWAATGVLLAVLGGASLAYSLRPSAVSPPPPASLATSALPSVASPPVSDAEVEAKAKAWLRRTKLLAEQGDVKGAIDELTRAIEAVGDFEKAYDNRAMFYLDRANSVSPPEGLELAERAVADFTTSLSIDEDVQTLLARGGALIALSQPERALADAERAYELAPENPHVFLLRGSAQAELDEPENALASFRSARDLGLDEVYDRRAHAAIAKLEQALERAPQELTAKQRQERVEEQTELGSARSRRGRPREALKHLDRALELDPDHLPALFYRGIARGILDDSEGAIEDFDHLLEIAPLNAKAYFNRGSVHLNRGDSLAALSDFDQSLALNPEYVEALAYRGLLRHNLGDGEGAIEDLSRARELSTDPDTLEQIEDWLRNSEAGLETR